MVHKSSIPLYWRLQKPRYRLIGSKCDTCNSLFYPPKNLCPKCRRKGEIRDFQFSGKGKILTFTIIRVPPEGFERYAPYAAAIIRLDDGINISGQVVGDINKVKTGSRIRTVFRKMYEDGDNGIIHYGLKWELDE